MEEARKFNLLSNVFMSVALNDAPACQYVLRILTGINDLVVKEIRSQYRISKIESHDAILDNFWLKMAVDGFITWRSSVLIP